MSQNTQEVANRFYEMAQQGKDREIWQALYSPECQSIENDGHTVQGFEAMQEKGDNWQKTMEIKNVEVSQPIVGDGHFAVTYAMDLVHVESQQPMKMTEIGVYEVQNGQITKEQFFYPPMG